MDYNENQDLDVRSYNTRKNKKKKEGRLKKFIVAVTVGSIVGGSCVGIGLGLTLQLLGQNTLAIEESLPMSEMAYYEEGIYPMANTSEINSISDIASNVGPSIVSIVNTQVVNTWGGDQTQTGLGSGVIFKEDEEKLYVLTNAHVVEGATKLMVTFLGNYKTSAEIVGLDTATDIAVVSIDKETIPVEARDDIKIAPLGDSDNLMVGDVAVAIGTPLSEAYNNTVTVGVISALDRKVTFQDKEINLIQTDAAINPGNSGGALIGPTGEVIGINTMKLVDNGVEGMGFAIPINEAKPIAEELILNGKISRPTLGIEVITMTEDLGALYEVPVGVYIMNVTPGGSADVAGIQPNDIILEFAGQKITQTDDLLNALAEQQIGDTVTMRVLRGDEIYNVDIHLQGN